MAESVRITLVALFFFRMCVGGRFVDEIGFDTLLVRIIVALLSLFLMIDGTLGQVIRRSLKITQIAGLTEILHAFLKCLFLRVRQKVRQFAVDTELLVTCKPTC